ncbi:hypothetical protein C8R45DRAFT_1162625 [Mycena sanguinolenta]|nr:hypothetical protein C8R45DRAFT_1162625 [Mycena sanguinolenta]
MPYTNHSTLGPHPCAHAKHHCPRAFPTSLSPPRAAIRFAWLASALPLNLWHATRTLDGKPVNPRRRGVYGRTKRGIKSTRRTIEDAGSVLGVLVPGIHYISAHRITSSCARRYIAAVSPSEYRPFEKHGGGSNPQPQSRSTFLYLIFYYFQSSYYISSSWLFVGIQLLLTGMDKVKAAHERRGWKEEDEARGRRRALEGINDEDGAKAATASSLPTATPSYSSSHPRPNPIFARAAGGRHRAQMLRCPCTTGSASLWSRARQRRRAVAVVGSRGGRRKEDMEAVRGSAVDVDDHIRWCREQAVLVEPPRRREGGGIGWDGKERECASCSSSKYLALTWHRTEHEWVTGAGPIPSRVSRAQDVSVCTVEIAPRETGAVRRRESDVALLELRAGGVYTDAVFVSERWPSAGGREPLRVRADDAQSQRRHKALRRVANLECRAPPPAGHDRGRGTRLMGLGLERGSVGAEETANLRGERIQRQQISMAGFAHVHWESAAADSPLSGFAGRSSVEGWTLGVEGHHMYFGVGLRCARWIRVRAERRDAESVEGLTGSKMMWSLSGDLRARGWDGYYLGPDSEHSQYLGIEAGGEVFDDEERKGRVDRRAGYSENSSRSENGPLNLEGLGFDTVVKIGA